MHEHDDDYERIEQSAAKRDNANKPKLSYAFLFPKALEALARVKEFGGAKYGDGNWQKGGKPDREYLDACCRHIAKAMNNESPFDDESRCLHLGHALWNLMALIELNHEGPVMADDFYEACQRVLVKREPPWVF